MNPNIRIVVVNEVQSDFLSAESDAFDIPAYQNRSSAPIHLTVHQAVDVNPPIGCGSALAFPDDTIVGDGVVVIPCHLADKSRRRRLR